MDEQEEHLRRKLRTQTVDAWATADFLRRKVHKSARLMRLMATSSVIVPFIIGIIALNFPKFLAENTWATAIATGVLAVHGILSTLILVYSSPDRLRDAQESEVRNRNIALRSDRQRMDTTVAIDSWKLQAQTLINEYEHLEENDENRFRATDQDRRRSLRVALRQFQEKCGLCKRPPTQKSLPWRWRGVNRYCNRCGELN